MPEDLGAGRVVAVRGDPTAITTGCKHCGQWSETTLGNVVARQLAVQLLVAADRVPIELLLPTTPERT